jgi:hypothetical protein
MRNRRTHLGVVHSRHGRLANIFVYQNLFSGKTEFAEKTGIHQKDTETTKDERNNTMENQVPEDNYRALARERSHEEARQTVITNRMLVQTLVIINGVAAVAILAFHGIRTTGNSDRSTLLLSIILYSIGIFTAIFAGLYIRRASQESALFWQLKSYQDVTTHQHEAEKHLRQMIRSKRWLTILLIVSEFFFLTGCLASAISI